MFPITCLTPHQSHKFHVVDVTITIFISNLQKNMLYYVSCTLHCTMMSFYRVSRQKKLLTECYWSHSITSSRHPLLLAISTGLGNSSLVVSYKDLKQGQVLPSPKSCLWKKIWPHSTQFWLIVWAPAA